MQKSPEPSSSPTKPKKGGPWPQGHRHVRLSPEDKAHLEELITKGSTPVKVHKRALGLLLLDQGHSLKEVATQIGLNYNTVAVWREAYKSVGLALLLDQPRSGRPPQINGEIRAKITALACSPAPEGHSQWSLRLLADRAVELGVIENISHSEVGLILKKTNSSRT